MTALSPNVKFSNGAFFDTGRDILTPLLVEMNNEFEVIAWLEDEYTKLGFTMYTPLTPDGKISSLIWPQALGKIGEDEEAPVLTLEQGYIKGYELETRALQHKITKVFKKWIESNQAIGNADSSVKQELANLVDAMKYLVEGYALTLNIIATKVLANWFSVSAANGAGSAAGDGKALFATDHIIKKTWGSFSNVAFTSTVNPALSATSLQDAIIKMKKDLRAMNGRRIKTPEYFDLIVGRWLETSARVILNSTSDQAWVYAWTGNNANLLNVFSFNGSKVRLVVSNILGDLGEVDSEIVGSDTMWFVANTEQLKKRGAFRLIHLWEKEITVYTNEATSSTFVKLDTHFTADHYDAQSFIVWSSWLGS